MRTIDGLKKIPFMQVISKLEISVAQTDNRLLIVVCLYFSQQTTSTRPRRHNLGCGYQLRRLLGHEPSSLPAASGSLRRRLHLPRSKGLQQVRRGGRYHIDAYD